MNREQYRSAFDQIPFSEDFQERTVSLLRSRALETQNLKKEQTTMKLNWIRKPAVIAAAAALLVLSVSAASIWLSPAQVAQHAGQPALAAAFESPDAVILNETVETGDLSVTLLGLVSGAGLTDQNVDVSHTYAVVALNRLDGTPMDNGSFSFTSYPLTPLVSGYSPLAVNNWTLGSFASGFDADGTYYYLLDTQDLGMFADRTVYLAFYEGGAPDSSIFTVAEDGSISFAEDFEGVHALFTLPLDPALADPAAAEAFVEDTGLNHWFTDNSFVSFSMVDSRGDVEDAILYGSNSYRELSAEDYETYMEQETRKLHQQVEEGVLSQENCDKTVAEMEKTLAGIKDGTLIAFMGDETGVSVMTAPSAAGDPDLDVRYTQEENGVTIPEKE